MTNTRNDYWKYMLAKPAVTAAAGAATLSLAFPSPFLFGQDSIFAGRSIGPMFAGAILGGISSVAVESINGMILGIPRDASLNTFPSFAAHIFGGASVFAAVPWLFGQTGAREMKVLAASGALSEIVAQYVHQQFVVGGAHTVQRDVVNRTSAAFRRRC